jgi:hypothetical protein
MATTTQATPLMERPIPDPRKHPLRALKTILRFYLPLGGHARLGLPAGFAPLANVALSIEYFLSEGYVSTLLCCLIPAFLLMMDKQVKRKKAAQGGRVHPNRFTSADLEQHPAKREELRRLGTDTLFHLLGEELRVLVRVLRAAQMAYRCMDDAWLTRHRAAAIVLLRVAQVSAELRHRGSRFLAEECLRYQARRLWEELFAGRPAPGPVYKWLKPLPEEEIKRWGVWRMVEHLAEEQAAGRPIPAPCEERLPVWVERLSE